MSMTWFQTIGVGVLIGILIALGGHIVVLYDHVDQLEVKIELYEL